MSQEHKNFFSNIVANAAWDGLKQLWGPAVLAAIVGLWQKLKHGSLDWYAITGMFLVASALAFLNFRKPRTVATESHRSTSDAKPEPKLKIHRAVYAAGLSSEVSATDELQNAVRDGLVVTVDNGLGGLLKTDPASGVRKTLEIEYSYGSHKHFTVSRREYPSGEPPMRLVLPEDTEVKRLENVEKERDTLLAELSKPKQDGLCNALKQIADADAKNIANLLRVVSVGGEFKFDGRSEPYIELHVEILNCSVFEVVATGELTGYARYGGSDFATRPRIYDISDMPFLGIDHAQTGKIKIRQNISNNLADVMWAECDQKHPIDFGPVGITFKKLLVGFSVENTYWFGLPTVAMAELKRL